MDIEFAKMTKHIMSAKSLTEGELAKLLDISQPTIHRIKTGQIKMPRYRTAKKLIALYEKTQKTDQVN